MMGAGRLRQRRRPLLLTGLLLSTLWAAWWLWRPNEPDVDFRFETDPMQVMVLDDLVTGKPMILPYYNGGQFHSATGHPIAARTVIRYEEGIPGRIGPFYTATFRMAQGTTRADFTRAVSEIWSVCGADIVAAAPDQDETFLIRGQRRGGDCAKAIGRLNASVAN